MSNPQVIKIREFKYPADPSDFLAEVYERHPSQGDVYLVCCATKDRFEDAKQAAEDYMETRKIFGTTFLPIEG